MEDTGKINARRSKEGFLWESTVQRLDLLRSKKVAAKLSAGDAPPLLGQGTYDNYNFDTTHNKWKNNLKPFWLKAFAATPE